MKPRTISEQLRHAIKTADVTRYRLAKESGVTESILSKFMAGAGMNSANIDRLCVALKLELKHVNRTGGKKHG